MNQPHPSSETSGAAPGQADGGVQDRVISTLSASKHAVDDTIYTHPMESVAIAFIAGAGIGALIGTLLREPPSRSWFDRRLDEGLARRLSHAVSQAVPNPFHD